MSCRAHHLIVTIVGRLIAVGGMRRLRAFAQRLSTGRQLVRE